ncbi:MAG: gamma-glutamyl-gamma-aminobutyrate hydrolase family protein [Deltaproteobacteria bacterium]|jgi:putative glutamine amidotransferase|nr:gamma-glutamyl-gamma-aminobutyrate hydrolase family protein [Deltaproteobacteria bacterium]
MIFKWPLIILTATNRPTLDWQGPPMSLVQSRVSFQYCEAVYQAGGIPMISPTFTGDGPEHFEGRGWPQAPPREIKPLTAKAEAVMDCASALILTGGGDVTLTDGQAHYPNLEYDRDRDFWEAALLKAAIRRKKPVLGICRGLQLINKFFGGTLWLDLPSQFHNSLDHQQTSPRTKVSHKVLIEPKSRLASICGQTELMVNSGHHQAIKEVAPQIVVSARSPDGVIEAIEAQDGSFIIGVQWHPEALAFQDAPSASLFKALVVAAGG